MVPRALRWIGLAALAVALGLGLAGAQAAFALPPAAVQIGLIVLLGAALVFGILVAVGYYRALRENDEWD